MLMITNVHLQLLLVDLCFNAPKAGKFILLNLIGGKWCGKRNNPSQGCQKLQEVLNKCYQNVGRT